MVSKELLCILFLGCLAVVSVSAVSAYPLYGDTISPTFSNKIETGSIMTFNTGSVNTQLGDSFTMDGAYFGTEIFNNVQVTSYSDGLPSIGSMLAFIRGSVKEGGGSPIEPYGWNTLKFDPSSGEFKSVDSSYGYWQEKAEDLAMTMSFNDYTSFTGSITDFRKSMSYTSSGFF